MKNNLLLKALEKSNTWVFFGFLILYQVFFVFQGMDFSDEGFYFTFYQQIFKAPQSVEYNFMYWLSGIIGGAWLWIFPQGGLLWLRLGGVFAVTGTLAVVYHLFRNFIPKGYLKLGLLITLVIMGDDPKSLNYDNLTTLFFVSTCWFLFYGMVRNRLSYFIVAGFFLSLNTFTRVPNLAGISLAAVIFIHALLNKEGWKAWVSRIAAYAGGFAITTGIIVWIMRISGQLNVFLDCLGLVAQMGKSDQNPHGLKKLISLFISDYTGALVSAIVFLSLVIASSLLIKKAANVISRNILAALVYLVVLFAFYLAWHFQVLSWFRLLSTITGLSLLAILFMLFSNRSIELKTLALLGGAMILVQPLGSDHGLFSVGRYSLYLALPIAAWFYLTISNSSIAEFGTRVKTFSFIDISDDQLGRIKKWTVYACLFLFIYYAVTYTWNDNRSRMAMIHPIHSTNARGIFTTAARANAINELLAASAPYVHEGDYVLAYDVLAMYHSLTQTRPFMRNSWPMLYDSAVFESEFDKALNERKQNPVIIFQKVNTVNSIIWPDPNDDNAAWDYHHPRNRFITRFIESQQYTKVWENNAFMLFIPK